MSKASSHDDRRELAVLIVFAGGLAQHWFGKAIMAVHDLGKEIALDAVQSAIDFGLDVAMGRDHAIVLGRHHDAAAGAAEPARRLVPLQFACGAFGDEVGGAGDRRHSPGERRHRGRLELENLAAIEFGSGHGNSPKSGGRFDGVENKRSGIDVGQQRELLSVVPSEPASGASTTTTSLPLGSRP